MQKRGLSQIDWAMSLGIFVLFIAWFFMFLMPQYEIDASKDALVLNVKNNFYRDYSWNIEKVPLFVFTKNVYEYTPIIVNFSLDWAEFAFDSELPYVNENNQLVFLSNIGNYPETIWLINGMNTTSTKGVTNLIATPTWATTEKNIGVYFDGSFLNRIYYNGTRMLSSYRVYFKANGTDDFERYNAENNTFTDLGVMAKYKSFTQGISHTFFVYAMNSVVHSFVSVNNPEFTDQTYEYLIKFNLGNYTNYYSNNLIFGSFNITGENSQASFSSEYVTLYNDKNAVSFFFDRNTSMMFNMSNATLNVQFLFLLDDAAEFEIVYHEGSYNNLSRYGYNYTYGIIERHEGFSLDKIRNSLNYEELKESWKYPKNKEFSLTVWDAPPEKIGDMDDILLGMGPEDPETIAVHSEDIPDFILDEKGEKTPITINIKVW
ncbi:MAG: hypothetical protein KKF44_09060 [Nanoarchaeota archaeon]|nr:hypothetical protein [Nanoarchaeota archaeon]